MKKVLTIAGSDCSGGAGIQADLKTMTALGCYGMSVITALTAQNTTGVFGVQEAEADFVKLQIDCVFKDIAPDAVKIGMVSSAPIIEAIAERLAFYRPPVVVLDPVMISTSGSRLLEARAISALIDRLMPLSAMITPNIPEAEELTGMSIAGDDDMLSVASALAKTYGGAILLKGGHLKDSCRDLLFCQGDARWFESPKIDTRSTHGTGCTLSSAIACFLAQGRPLKDAVAAAKRYTYLAIKSNPDLGAGAGPLNHLAGADAIYRQK